MAATTFRTITYFVDIVIIRDGNTRLVSNCGNPKPFKVVEWWANE